jgi:bifunctional non-homologous end joining protein LigD
LRKTSAHKPRRSSESSDGKRALEAEPARPSTTELGSYRNKRDPAATNEPFGPERNASGRATRAGRFVVHLHAATRTHYDVRVQVGGVLKSFAVPKGPSLDPSDKRLAVLTEDHPLEYLDFEAVIPEGNYGAGPMIAWDIGRLVYLETSAEEGLERGKLDFSLDGFKLKGRFALVHTGGRAGRSRDEQNQWLLFKKGDASASAERDILSEEPYSVLSGLTIEELARRDEVAGQIEQLCAELGAPEAELDAKSLTPMLCALAGAELEDRDRIYELKLDGVRIIADKIGPNVALRYRNGRPASASYPEIARAVRALCSERLVLDGEIVAFDAAGRPTLERIAPRIHARRPLDVAMLAGEIPVLYFVFDVLQVGRRKLIELPLASRKRVLSELVRGKGFVRVLDHYSGKGRQLFEFCKQQRLEGVVAKRASSVYRPGPHRSEDWVKIKCERDEDFVVIGWLGGKRTRERLGALCIASFVGDRLRFRGRVGSGLDERSIEALVQALEPLKINRFPAEGAAPEDLKQAQYVRPELVVRVRYLDWTEDGRLRAPVFLALRPDMSPEQCRAAPPDEVVESISDAEEPVPVPVPVPMTSDAAPVGPAAPRISITNRNKVFWPDDGFTKGDLCDYYAAVADRMLPFLDDRPVVLVRYPDGIAGKSFYQWNVPAGTPGWIRTLELPDRHDPQGEGGKHVFLLDSIDALLYIANLGCIPLHVLAARERSLDDCDFLTIDFDIGERPFRDAVVLALDLKELLDSLDLVSFPKTSGQKGLHVLVPLGQGIGFDAAKLLVELLGRIITDKHPDLATMERRVNKRGRRVFVDIGQTGPSRTIVAPYSVRAVPGATVSTPLFWQEVHAALDPRRFTIMTVPTRLTELGDPLQGFDQARPNIGKAVSLLDAQLRRDKRR